MIPGSIDLRLRSRREVIVHPNIKAKTTSLIYVVLI